MKVKIKVGVKVGKVRSTSIVALNRSVRSVRSEGWRYNLGEGWGTGRARRLTAMSAISRVKAIIRLSVRLRVGVMEMCGVEVRGSVAGGGEEGGVN